MCEEGQESVSAELCVIRELRGNVDLIYIFGDQGNLRTPAECEGIPSKCHICWVFAKLRLQHDSTGPVGEASC